MATQVPRLKSENDLLQLGFTTSGAKRYVQTIDAYSESLLSKSVAFGEAAKASDSSVEITHDHVRAAAHTIQGSFGREAESRFAIPTQIGEYVFTALAGVSGGNLDEWWGTLAFVVSVAIAVVLFVVRQTALKSKR